MDGAVLLIWTITGGVTRLEVAAVSLYFEFVCSATRGDEHRRNICRLGRVQCQTGICAKLQGVIKDFRLQL